MIVHDHHDVVTLARTLWGEARGEPSEGQIAVAWVIRNRATRARFADRLLGHDGAVAWVCLAPRQFSCWNESDPNRAKLLMLRDDQCRGQVGVALSVLDGLVADPTHGADHYHTINPPAWASAWPPDWAPSMRETARFGGHVFYDSRSAP
jgi:spore germination cell wall hydrolase CwlJ-like protein